MICWYSFSWFTVYSPKNGKCVLYCSSSFTFIYVSWKPNIEGKCLRDLMPLFYRVLKQSMFQTSCLSRTLCVCSYFRLHPPRILRKHDSPLITNSNCNIFHSPGWPRWARGTFPCPCELGRRCKEKSEAGRRKWPRCRCAGQTCSPPSEKACPGIPGQ